ncbi:amidohydrolase family protein [Halococcus sp. PRR34]|uniref:dihydroorotase n=1 Tax=Halococcus sp. PRR34 TaxID=3020830 RepID=UPI00235DD384|nr:amidohydrolase family protein [Halococcus sp. PRR34]
MSNEAKTIISGGTCVTTSGTYEADVIIDGETIVALGDGTAFDADERIDASGLLVMPGFVDPHVHIDDSASIDSYATATAAAALGGVTTILDFAWQTENNDLKNEPRPLMEGIARKNEKASEMGAYVDYGLHGGLTVEDSDVIEELGSAVEAGVTSFKMFTAYDFGVSNGFIRRALDRIADLDAVGVFHAEDDDICQDLVSEFRDQGNTNPTWYPKSRPDYAEAMAVDDILRLATETGAKYYGVHTSCRKSAETVADYIGDGSQVRAETCTHYTTLDNSVYKRQGNLPLIAPPIRRPDDVEAVLEHLQAGVLSVVSTDHAPHYREDKQTEWWNSPYGAGSLQVSVPIFHDTAVKEGDFSHQDLVKLMSANPARTFGMSEKGSLNPGTDADVVLFNPSESCIITEQNDASKQDFSLYEGREVTGRVEKTFVRGEMIVDDGELVGTADHGVFVERECPDWSR